MTAADPVPVPQPPGRVTWGSYASALRDRRKIIVRTIAETLASGGPVEDEMEAAEQVVAALERLHGIPVSSTPASVAQVPLNSRWNSQRDFPAAPGVSQ